MTAFTTMPIRRPPARALRRGLLLGMATLAFLLPACASRVESPRVDDSDFVFPEPGRGELNARDQKLFRGAWNDVLTGQTERAEKTVRALMVPRPDLRAGLSLLGFAALRANRLEDAEAFFAAVLTREPADAAALIGLASVKRKLGLPDQALPLYVMAVRQRPNDAALARRAAEVKFAVTETALARAVSLTAEGRKAEAMAMLQKALDVAPELASIRLDLADRLIESGRRTEALALLGAAEEPDRNIALKIATIRFEDGDLGGAEMAIRRGPQDLADEPEGAALLARIRDQRAALALPPPLRAIGEAPRITRAELAALVVVRVEALAPKKATVTEVASDLSRTWARPQVIRAIELGLMDVYPNHTFQPSGAIRRGELAVVAARVLDLLGWGRSNGAAPKDMSPSHLQYRAVLRVVGAGVMQNTASGAFEPWRIVSGAEAKSVVEALARLSR